MVKEVGVHGRVGAGIQPNHRGPVDNSPVDSITNQPRLYGVQINMRYASVVRARPRTSFTVQSKTPDPQTLYTLYLESTLKPSKMIFTRPARLWPHMSHRLPYVPNAARLATFVDSDLGKWYDRCSPDMDDLQPILDLLWQVFDVFSVLHW